MIYVIIARKSELVGGRVKKYAPLLPKSALEYIKSAKNEKTHDERVAGYTLLTLSLMATATNVGERIDTAAIDINAVAEKSVIDATDIEINTATDIEINTAIGANKSQKMRHFPRLDLTAIEKYTAILQNVEITRAPNGKPMLVGSDIHFNISHSGDLIVLAMSNEREVGVDVQENIDSARAARLSGRYFTKPIVTHPLSDAKYFYISQTDRSVDFVFMDKKTPDCILVPRSQNEYTDVWTVGEAILKCDGRGFEAMTQLDEIAGTAMTDTVNLILDGKRYSLTVAVREN